MKRFTVLAVALLAAVPATARADVLWDLVFLAGDPANATGSYGATSKVINQGAFCGATNNLACGSITALSNSDLFIVGNDYNQIVGGGPASNNGGNGALGAYNMGAFSEKGLGLCIAGSSATPNGCNSTAPPFKEIDADAGVNTLFLNLTTVTNSGPLNRIWLSSTQVNEDWIVEYTTGAIGGAYSEICHGSTNSGSGFTDIAACDVNVGAITFLRIRSVGGDGFSGDFSVQALRFSSVVPEPGTMGLLATGLVALTGAGFIRRRNKKS